MATARRYRFVISHTALTLTAIVALAAISALTLEVVFVASLLAFLIAMEFTSPVAIEPAWRGRAKWILRLGLIGFLYLVGRRILEILAPGVV